MSRTFLVDDARVRRLSATRQGRVSLGGFAYQAGYAVARLASLHTRRPVLDLSGIPELLRYDWAEDLDELEAGGRAVFTQCKRIADTGEPERLAAILVGLAPKWLWTPEERRAELRFRLVCPDPRFAGRGPVPLAADRRREEVLTAAEELLAKMPGRASDRALWQAEAEAAGLRRLLEALWSQTEVLYLPAEPLGGDPAGPLLPAERSALDLLLRSQHLEPSRQRQALAELRSLLHSNVVELDLTGDRPVPVLDRAPRVLDGDDVRYALFGVQMAAEEQPPFRVVTRIFLEQEAVQPRSPYVARPPRWADVVHGQDAEVKFLEREQTEPLFAQVRKLLESTGDGEALPALFVLGAPGAGKTTLVRRVAARAVQEGLAVVGAPKLNLERLEAEDAEPLLRSLARLEEGTLPVLLALDDPLFAESGWDDLLRRLARRSRRVAVLAASPDYLFQENHHRLGRQVDVRTFLLPRPRRPEREALALLHGRDPRLFQDREEDFLVLAMEASAGVSFETIVDRIWVTLNFGLPIHPATRPEDLPWTVRAYLVVCAWHRLYLTCPEILLRRVLDRFGRDRPPGGFQYDLRRLTNEQGWMIFGVGQPEARYLGFLGLRIGASHPLVAGEAWRRRPAAAFDIGDWVIEVSLEVQAAAVDLGLWACRVEREILESTGRGLLSRLVEIWERAARTGSLETRNLCLLYTVLCFQGFEVEAQRLESGLEACASRLDEQSWLAVLSLLWHRRGSPARLGVDLPSVIRVANLHLAPNRATNLLNKLQYDPDAANALLDRIAATSDHPNAGHLLAHLVSTRPDDATVLAKARAWARTNPENSGVPELLARLAAAAPREPGLVEEAMAWIRSHPYHPNACRILIYLLERNPGDESICQQAVSWFDAHRGHPEAPALLAGLIEECGADQDIFRRGEELIQQVRNPRVLMALLRATHANSRFIALALDWALDWLRQDRRRTWSRKMKPVFGELLAAFPQSAMRFLAVCGDRKHKQLLLMALSTAIKERPVLAGPLLDAAKPLAPRDFSLLLLHLLGTRSDPVETFLATWLADPPSLEDRETLLRSIRSKAPLRERLLGREDLDPEVRRQLLEEVN